MLRTSTCRLLAVVGLLWVAPVSAVLAQTTAASAQDNTIIVTARTPQTTQRFVEQVSIAPQTADQLARWDDNICTSVAGLPQRQGQFLADRIAQRAHAIGLSPAPAGCTPNVSVIVTGDSDALARQMYQREPSLFALRQQANVTTLDQAGLDAFLSSSRPVRWWHVSERLSADGISLSGDAANGGMSNAPVARSSGSRLHNDTRQDLSRVIIIVDARRVGGAQLAALADYVAMVALAQINPSADTAQYPSILSLFSDRPAGAAPITEMTDWDLAYLDGLYHATRNASSVSQQQREITQRMLSHEG
jgi:hypothetical protein